MRHLRMSGKVVQAVKEREKLRAQPVPAPKPIAKTKKTK